MYKQFFHDWRFKNDDDTFTPTAAFGLSGPSGTKTWLHPSMEEMGQTLERSVSVFGKRVLNQLNVLGKVNSLDRLCPLDAQCQGRKL